MKKIIIIGAGITGLSAAWKLSENGYKTILIESDKTIGGLAKSINFDKYILDIGPHTFFAENKEIYDKVLGLFEGEEGLIPYSKRKVKMIFKGRYVDYPLSAKSILLQMGIVAPILSCLSYIKSYIKNFFKVFMKKNKQIEKTETVEEWAINNFGRYLFNNFFKPYTEQFWKIKTSELSNRVIPTSKKMDFMMTLKHLLIKKYFFISKREPGPMTLAERENLPSYYPKKGFGEIAKKISKKVLLNKNSILTEHKVNEIYLNHDDLKTVKTDKGNFSANIIISTIPLDRLIEKIKPSPSIEITESTKKLRYLSLIIIYLITNKQNVLNCQYCYYVNKPYNRISEMNSFSRKTSPDDQNLLAIEITCHYEDKIWKSSKEDLLSMCIKNIEKDLHLSKDEILSYKVVKVASAYPIYKKNYEKDLTITKNYLDNLNNFYSVGRQGMFYYGDIDQMIEIGFNVAKKIISKK